MRIAIVNDLAVAVEAIRRSLISSGRHQVAWVANNGLEAIDLCSKDRPDLLLMDMVMPVMDGVAATRQIMTQSPCPILIVTATVDGHSAKVYEALGAGALDVIRTPSLDSTGLGIDLLLQKIESISRLIAPPRTNSTAFPAIPNARGASSQNETLIAIGASTGGPLALAEIFQQLPSLFPASFVIIQHVDQQFSQGLADWLSSQSRIPIRIAKPGDVPSRSVALLAGTDDHLIFKDSKHLDYTSEPSSYSYRPSVDVFFSSALQFWPGRIIGVLLTGMGKDGALGLKSLRDAQHHTIAQDRNSSVVFGMPKAAAELHAAVEILPLSRIAHALAARLNVTMK